MTHNHFEEYKKAVKSKYDLEKNGIYSSFLLLPSRANLRRLCTERFNGNNSIDDLATFKLLFGFDFEEGRNKLKSETGRFRSIENFYKGVTDTNDIEIINLAAILVDFVPRPFKKFSRAGGSEEVINETQTAVENVVKAGKEIGGKNIPDDISMGNPKTKNRKRKIVVWIGGVIAIFSVGFTAKQLLLPKKECMQWQDNHYELVDCNEKVNTLFANAPIEPIDEKAIDLRKIEVCDTFTFFSGDKALVWYCKVDGEPEYFDGPGAGFHPITKKQLNPITDHIIDKYVRHK